MATWTPPNAPQLINPCPGAPGVLNSMPTNSCILTAIVEVDRLVISLLQGMAVLQQRLDEIEKLVTPKPVLQVSNARAQFMR